jgi:predicted HTH transcriptional regulator
MNDLSEDFWRKFTTRSREPSEIVLLKRNLLSKEESGAVRASVAGILLCCEQPERFLPNAFIEAVRYRGTMQDSNYQIDAQRIRGTLDQQIKQAMAFLMRNQVVAATKKLHRVEVPQFSERAVFEAIVNAVAHRDYSRQSTRNELITSLLAESPVAETIGDVERGFYMEKRGDGVPIILNESTKLSGKTPVYQLIDESELLLTIYAAKKGSVKA